MNRNIKVGRTAISGIMDNIEVIDSDVLAGLVFKRVIGRGGQGSVYGYDFNGVPVAVKISGHSVQGLEDSKGYIDWINTVLPLMADNAISPHENIARNILSVEKNGHLISISEYANGCNLDEWKAQAVRSDAEIVSVISQVLMGLIHIHKYKIIHGDIKPSNVIVDQRGVVKIIDFSCMQIPASHQYEIEISDIVGNNWIRPVSIYYCAPESQTNPTQVSDLYSVGLMTYFLKTGIVPFSSRLTMWDICHRKSICNALNLLDGHKASQAGIFKSYILRSCECDPRNRIQNAVEAMEILEKLL